VNRPHATVNETAAGVDRAVHRVGFIGLGSQGAGIARKIALSGFRTGLWARRPAVLNAFEDLEVTVAGSAAELAAASDLVGVCVRTDADVEQVIDGPEGLLAGMPAGGVIVVHSTVHPDTCRRLAQRAAQQGVDLIDAPVSGGGDAALAGRLLVMVGGDEQVVARCRPVFAVFGAPVLHLGPIGSGQIAKLCNNLLLTANFAVAPSALTLGRELGVAPEALVEVIASGSGASYALGPLRRAGLELAPMGSMIGPLLQKDVRLLMELAADAGATGGAALAAADLALEAMGCRR
jgi:3-hydroxyisobutyrate dehydrogenase